MLSDNEMMRIGQVIKKVHHAAEKVFGTSALFITAENGVEVGQTVPHIHFHYIPAKPVTIQRYVSHENVFGKFFKSDYPEEMGRLWKKMKDAMN